MKNENGFTLLELIVVIAILAILIGVASPNVSKMMSNDKNLEMANHKVVVEKCLKQYYALQGKYPPGPEDPAIAPSGLDTLQSENYGVNIDRDKYKYTYTPENGIVDIKLK